MTDGFTVSEDQIKSKNLLSNIFKKNNKGMFFAIGFGYGYKRGVL